MVPEKEKYLYEMFYDPNNEEEFTLFIETDGETYEKFRETKELVFSTEMTEEDDLLLKLKAVLGGEERTYAFDFPAEASYNPEILIDARRLAGQEKVRLFVKSADREDLVYVFWIVEKNLEDMEKYFNL